MGIRGRKPKPTNIKVLEGNPGKRPLNQQEPVFDAAYLRVPYGRLPAEGQRLWRELAPQLTQAGVLTQADLPALEMACLHYAVVRQAVDLIREEGIITSTRDSIKKHPAMSVLNENSAMFYRYLAAFGLTPSDRVKIKADPIDKERTLAELLFEGVDG